MKKIKKILPVLLAVVLLLAALPAQVLAASEGTPGQTVTVPISFSGVYGLQGTVTLDNTEDFTFNSVSVTAGNASTNGAYRFSTYSTDGNALSGTIQVSVTIKSTAQAGDKCVISVNDGISTTADYQDKAWSGANTLVVKAAASDDSNKPSDTTKPSTPSKPSSPNTSTTNKDTVDYSELEKQIEIAESLTKDGYTGESWTALQAALADAKAALGSGNQDKVDAAAQALKDAIAGLVKMDYSKLQEALDSANALIGADELGELWAKLANAIANYTALLTSDDQAAVDAAAAEIMDLIDQITALLGEAEGAVTEVEPDGKYCNIPIHKVWPILFIVSLIVNVLLAFLLLSGKKKKEEKAKDDMPVVNYHIGDDDK